MVFWVILMKLERIKTNVEFRRIYSRGASFVSPYFVLYVANGIPGTVKFGITVSKKIGNAVCRNRAKRLIRAAFREVFPLIETQKNIVIVARTRILSVKSTTVTEELKKQLTKSGVIK